jgi:uncharacterized protein with GYD domain
MATYLMFGKYAAEGIRDISPARTEKAEDLIKEAGGKVKAGYVLLGDVDLVLITEFKNNEQALKASVGLAQLLGIGFTTAPAMEVDEFDKLIG